MEPTPATPVADRAPGSSGARRGALQDEGEDSPENRYELLEQLGEGSYGSVYKARDRVSEELVAIKIIPVTAQEEEGFAEIQREVLLLQECSHPNVVRYLGSLRAHEALWIIMEYCGGGSAADLMNASGAPLEEHHIAYICAEVIKGLAYLHSIGKVHRDVKCGNVLLTNSGEVKLADFGVAARLTSTMSKRNTFIGTPHWMAPEVIQESRYDGKVDVWSLGICTIEMAEQSPPRWAVHPMRVIFMISRDAPPHLTDRDKWSLLMHDFCAQCLQKDARRRPTARQLLQHKFIIGAPQGPPKGMAATIHRTQDWLAQRASAAKGAPAQPELQTANTAASRFGTMLQHDWGTPAGASLAGGQPSISGTVAVSGGASNASGTMVVSGGGLAASNASGTFVGPPEASVRGEGRSQAGMSDYMQALSRAPEGTALGADDGLSDYMAALVAVDQGTAGIRGAARAGAGRPGLQNSEPLSEVERLRERLRAVYEGGDVIPLPILKASRVSPLALLRPTTAPPLEDSHAEPGNAAALEVLRELANSVGSGAVGNTSGSSALGTGSARTPLGAYQNALQANGTPMLTPGLAPEAAPDRLPPELAARVESSPALLNLAKTLAYHKHCLDESILSQKESDELRTIVGNLSDTLRTILCL